MNWVKFFYNLLLILIKFLEDNDVKEFNNEVEVKVLKEIENDSTIDFRPPTLKYMKWMLTLIGLDDDIEVSRPRYGRARTDILRTTKPQKIFKIIVKQKN